MPKLSVGSWAFLPHDNLPVFDFHTIVHKLHNLGFDGIDFAPLAPHPTLDSLSTQEQRLKFKKLVTGHGIDFSALIADLGTQSLASSGDAATYLAAFERNLSLAADLGVPMIRLGLSESISVLQDQDISLIVERCTRTLDRCSKMAAERNIAVCWDGDLEPETMPAQLVQRVRNDLGNANFGLLFDTSYTPPGQEGDYWSRLAGLISHVQIAWTNLLLPEALFAEILAPGTPIPYLCLQFAPQPEIWTALAEAKRILDRHKKKLNKPPQSF